MRWEPGKARELRFAIENASNRTVALAGPDPALARVDVYAGPENDRICGTAPSPSSLAPLPAASLSPGDRVEVRVDLERACRSIPPGEYRFVVSYRSARTKREEKLWAGALPARYGTLVVEHGTAAARVPAVRLHRPERRWGEALPKREEPEE